MPETLLSVEDLKVQFKTREGDLPAVAGVSFSVSQRETLGIVGESGSGKSVTSLALIGLLSRNGRVTSGEVRFEGKDLTKLGDTALRDIRGSRIGMIFQ